MSGEKQGVYFADKKYILQMRSLHLDYKVFKLLRDAYRGGNTHANRWYSGQTVDNVLSYDRSSSYPDVMVNCKFPMKPFREMITPTIDSVMKNIKNGYAILMKVCVWNIRLKDQFAGIPYISKSKIVTPAESNGWLAEHPDAQYQIDNGRVLIITEAPVLMALTEIDLKIISKQYDIEHIEVIEAYCSKKDYLPPEFRELIINYYKDKTGKKGVDEEIYFKAKQKINALYGMLCQNPANIPWLYDEESKEFIKDKNIIDPESGQINDEALSEVYYKFIRSSVMAYQLGVWVCALARLRLQEMIDICGDQIVYVDTDSVKFRNKGKISFDAYNKKRIADDMKSGAFADDPKGYTHYMGVAECETPEPIQFKTLGAKKYLYRDSKGVFHLTVAGVSKKMGLFDLMTPAFEGKPYGFAAFENDFVFEKGGGLDVKYNDNVNFWYDYKGHHIHITDNCYLYNSTYKLGQTDEYKHLIEHLADVELDISLDRHFDALL